MQMSSILLAGFSLTTISLTAPAEEPFRTWTSVQGTTMEAQFVTNSAGSVVLAKRTGDRITLSTRVLSPADQEYIARKEAAAALPPPPIGYRDLRLRMTRDELTRRIKEDKTWEMHFASDTRADKITLTLGIRSFSDAKSWEVGSSDGKPLKWEQVHVVYKDDQVNEISLSGPTGDETTMENALSDWIQAAVKILTAQHGKPVSGPTQKFQMMSALRKMAFSEVARWKVTDDQEICIQAIKENAENKYRAQVTYRLAKQKKPAPGGTDVRKGSGPAAKK